VRIIGAEEAQAAVSGDRDVFTTREAPSVDLSSEERRDVGYPDEGPSWSASETGDAPPSEDDDEDEDEDEEASSGEVPPLPHWTEPPTGAVPAIFADDDSDADLDNDLDAWATISGSQPRFRAEGSDWAEADFAEELSGEHERLGALDEQGPVDEEAEFAEALAARRQAPRPKARAAAPPPTPRPAHHDAQPPGPAAARDLPTAIMTAAAVVVVALVCFQIGTTATAVLAAVIMGVATIELCTSLQTKGMRPATLLALVGSVSLPLAAKHYGTSAYPVYFALIVVFSMLWFLWQVTPGRPVLGIATTVLAFAYVGGLGGFAGLLLAAHDGVGLLLGVAICSVAYDVAGFFIGSQFGKHRIAPNVSPNKTVAGTVGGMLASIFFGWIAAGAISPWTHSRGLVLGVLVAFAAFLGDLSESMIKRDLGLKDFGSLLPGHGGILDRFDGLLFSLPIAYYLALHWHIF
jgi:phosphatidate cytidylyltransferase